MAISSYRVGVRRRFAGVFAALVVLSGCAHRYGLDRYRDGGHPIPRGASVYIALPEAGSFGDRPYPESGYQTRAALVEALRPHVSRVEVGTGPEAQEEALASARERETSRLVIARIEHWEDRATEWSGKPDRVTVDIRVLDVPSGEVLDAADVSAVSRWATFGGDHPQELLPRAVGDYVRRLVGQETQR